MDLWASTALAKWRAETDRQPVPSLAGFARYFRQGRHGRPRQSLLRLSVGMLAYELRTIDEEAMNDIAFGFQAALASAVHKVGPGSLPRGHGRLRATGWASMPPGLLEHHFSDYYRPEPCCSWRTSRRGLPQPLARHLGAGAAVVSPRRPPKRSPC